MNSATVDTISPLATDLRANDPDRFLATLFAPPSCREPLIALYAFDHELARIGSVVREPMAGLIRLQWWEDVIDSLDEGGAVRHPVVQGLHRAVTEDGLDVSYLKRAIDGRRQPFEEGHPPDQPIFERYLSDIGGSIMCAAAKLLDVGGENSLAIAERIGLVRAAWEQLNLLEKPMDDQPGWLPTAGLEGQGDAAGGSSGSQTRANLAQFALTEITEARRRPGSIRRSELAAFFPGTLAAIRLREFLRTGQQARRPSAVPTLIWHLIRGRF